MRLWDWLRRKSPAPAPRADAGELRPLRSMRGTVSAHEAGHAIVAWGATHVHSVTALLEEESGKTLCTGARIPGPYQRAAQWAEMVILLAGIAGELQVFGRFRSGPAASDLDKARQLAEALVAARYEPKIAVRPGRLPFDKMFREPLTEEERSLFDAAYGQAWGVIRAHRSRFWRLVALLHSRSEVTEEEMARVLGSRVPMKMLASIGVVTLVAPSGVERLSTEGEFTHVRK